VRTGFIDLRLPEKPGQALNVRVMAGDPSQRGGHHDRAHDLLQLDPASGAILDARPYARQGAGGSWPPACSRCTRAATSVCPGAWW
jgi:sulfite reductase (NADPH) flavoprotein alpha-component